MKQTWRARRHKSQNNDKLSINFPEQPGCEGMRSCSKGVKLEEESRRLIGRENDLFGGDNPSEEGEKDRLQEDLEALLVQVWMEVQGSFTSSGPQGALHGAMKVILQQEQQDRRWAGPQVEGEGQQEVRLQGKEDDKHWMELQVEEEGQQQMELQVEECLEGQKPPWRPLGCLKTHNTLLHNIVKFRLDQTTKDQSTRDQVFFWGQRVKEDLLMVVQNLEACYPPHMDLLNYYARLYHQTLRTNLVKLVQFGVGQPEDRRTLLVWTMHHYPRILGSDDFGGRIKINVLGSLLPENLHKLLEEEITKNKEREAALFLSESLRLEEIRWKNGSEPELLDGFWFSPLAINVIQVMDSSLAELRCVAGNPGWAQRITDHLGNFLCSYLRTLQDFLLGNHGNFGPVVKAQLVCEEQLRDYITSETGSFSAEQKRRCEDYLSTIRDSAFQSLTRPLHAQIKECLRPLWTSGWVDGSLPVVSSLLDFLNQNLKDLKDLKPVCRQDLLTWLQQEVHFQYVRRVMKRRGRSRAQQGVGATRMKLDGQMIDSFFLECFGSSSGSTSGFGSGSGPGSDSGPGPRSGSGSVLFGIAEVFRLQDPESLQMELKSLKNQYPDLSGAHISLLLSEKSGLSAAEVRSIRQTVEGTHPLDASTNPYTPFFSRIKVSWMRDKINQMSLMSVSNSARKHVSTLEQ